MPHQADRDGDPSRSAVMWFDTGPYESEMGYEWMVDLEQEARKNFIGKAALKRIKAEGVSAQTRRRRIAGPGKLGSWRRLR